MKNIILHWMLVLERNSNENAYYQLFQNNLQNFQLWNMEDFSFIASNNHKRMQLYLASMKSTQSLMGLYAFLSQFRREECLRNPFFSNWPLVQSKSSLTNVTRCVWMWHKSCGPALATHDTFIRKMTGHHWKMSFRIKCHKTRSALCLFNFRAWSTFHKEFWACLLVFHKFLIFDFNEIRRFEKQGSADFLNVFTLFSSKPFHLIWSLASFIKHYW